MSRPTRFARRCGWIADTDCIRGALVTTHKIAVHRYARDLFAAFDADADWLGEVSAVAKRPDGLVGHALDTVTARGWPWTASFRAPIGARHPGAEALVLGSGGAGLALTAHLLQRQPNERPASLVLCDVDGGRLDGARTSLQARDGGTSFPIGRYGARKTTMPCCRPCRPNSLVVNATGLGKDRPGSPLSPGVRFPQGGVVWEFNYRGPRDFLVQAEARREQDGLTVADGWTYFLYGWAHVMAEIFGVMLDDALFARLEAAAEAAR